MAKSTTGQNNILDECKERPEFHRNRKTKKGVSLVLNLEMF